MCQLVRTRTAADCSVPRRPRPGFPSLRSPIFTLQLLPAALPRMDHERRQRWEAAQEAHVVATIVLLAHQSELLLSTLPRHAAALAQAATSTTRAGGDVAELQQAVRALSLRTVAEQLRLRALRALQRAMQRAAPGLLMTTCRKGLGALTRSADLLAVWSQIAEATQGSGHSAALVRHVHDSAAVPLLVQRLCRAALLSTPTPQLAPSALLSGLLSLGGWGRGLGSPAPLPPPEPPVVTPASSSRRPAPPHSSAAEEAEAEAAVVVPTHSRDEVASQWRPGGQADQSGLEGTYRSTAPFRSRAEAEESARAAVRAASASAAVAARVRGEAAARVAEARAAERPAAGGTAAASVAPTLPHAAGSGAPLPGWRGVHGGPAAEAVRDKRRVDHLVILVHGVGPHDQQKMDRCNGDDPTPTANPSPSHQPHPDRGPSPEPEPESRVDRHPATLCSSTMVGTSAWRAPTRRRYWARTSAAPGGARSSSRTASGTARCTRARGSTPSTARSARMPTAPSGCGTPWCRWCSTSTPSSRRSCASSCSTRCVHSGPAVHICMHTHAHVHVHQLAALMLTALMLTALTLTAASTRLLGLVAAQRHLPRLLRHTPGLLRAGLPLRALPRLCDLL